MSAPKIKYTNMQYPEYDYHWRYQSLSEPLLSSELSRLARATRTSGADHVSFQPCPNPEEMNQDRVVIQDWNLTNGTWKFRAVFDGHAGHDTVDWTAIELPRIVRNSLENLISADGSFQTPQDILNILVQSISTLDNDLTKALLELFPTPEFIESLTDDQIRSVINDQKSGGKNAAIVARCMRGTTVLISLVDPASENVWTASLGDCEAVLAIKDEEKWHTSVPSGFHNGSDPSEQTRIRSEHPGEAQCVLNDRVLGAIAVTRAVGDHLFKLPLIYTTRIFMNAQASFQFNKNIHDFLNRNKTPPYLSNQADAHHACIKGKETCLLLCSDGLSDLYKRESSDPKKLAEIWFDVLSQPLQEGSGSVNLANYLLRHALGGDDTEKVSMMMMVEMENKWMDDTSIVVERLS